MRLPNKITPYSESTLPHLVSLLKSLKKSDRTPSELCKEMRKLTTSEVVEALDILFAFGMVDISDDGRSIRYVERD